MWSSEDRDLIHTIENTHMSKQIVTSLQNIHSSHTRRVQYCIIHNTKYFNTLTTHQLPGSVYQGCVSHPSCTLRETDCKETYIVQMEFVFNTQYCILKYTLDLSFTKPDLTLTHYKSTRISTRVFLPLTHSRHTMGYCIIRFS